MKLNIFFPNEAKHWYPHRKHCPIEYKTALRIDPFLAGEWQIIEQTLLQSGYEISKDGCLKFLNDRCDIPKPEYLMASTPHNFIWTGSDNNGYDQRGGRNLGVNVEAMKQPGAFAQFSEKDDSCGGTINDDSPSVIDENSDLLSEVVMKVCQERNLPIALKIGAHRGINPRLKTAGDGVVAFADASMLGRLCTRFPNVRFLATFLSRNNQHEACVLALKFSNLHI
jgi:hypothetical protein